MLADKMCWTTFTVALALTTDLFTVLCELSDAEMLHGLSFGRQRKYLALGAACTGEYSWFVCTYAKA